MGDRRAKDALFDALASAAKALGSGRRAEIIDLLAQGPRAVEEIATEIGQSTANTSHHVRALAAAGLLRSHREGTRIIYRLASPRVFSLWQALRDVAADEVAEIERLARDYLGDRARLESIDRAELRRRLKTGDVHVLDVRPRPEYETGHIPGASSIPIGELSKRLKDVPKDVQVVAYCRGPYCVFADDAVRLLRRKGYDAVRLADGFPDWHAAGLPVAKGAGGKR